MLKRTIWRTLIIAVMAVALAAAAACAKPEQPQPATAPESAQAEQSAPDAAQETEPTPDAAQEAEPAPTEAAEADGRAQLAAFTARDLDGNTVTEAVFANAKLTMLNVWGTFCGPCLMEMPDLGALAQEYADRGVQIIGLVGDVGETEADAEAVREIVEKTGANYVHLLPSADLTGKVLSGLMYYPTTIFFDSEGYVVDDLVIGSKSKADWETIFDRMLQLVAADEAESAGA